MQEKINLQANFSNRKVIKKNILLKGEVLLQILDFC
jgi:hypothetical protein